MNKTFSSERHLVLKRSNITSGIACFTSFTLAASSRTMFLNGRLMTESTVSAAAIWIRTTS